jgi:glycosyltransferase involved in cell wall biosynthesis
MLRRRRVRQQISLLVPLGGDDPIRARNWAWLERYWRDQLPHAEIVIGRDRKSQRRWHRRRPLPFSKAVAINNAFKRSRGDVIVLLDSDAYLDAKVVQHCAERLRAQRKTGVRSWFVPYDHLYRLTRQITKLIVESDPRHPLRLSTPPPPQDVDGRDGSGPINVFGAMCQIMPREAFIAVGGMDPRFRGWGAEDYAFALALDELWGPRHNTPNDILHLWHPSFTGGSGPAWTVKMWANQTKPGVNNRLGARYANAIGKPDAMRSLVDEGRKR